MEVAEQIQQNIENSEASQPTKQKQQVPVYEKKREATMDEVAEVVKGAINTDHASPDEDLIEDTPDWSQPSSRPQHQANTQIEQLQGAMSETLRQRAALEAQAKQINWEELREDDPGEFAAQWQMFKEADSQLRQQEQQLTNAYQQISGQDARQRQQQLEAYVQNEQAKLLDVIPAWRDEGVRRKESQQIRKNLKDRGFSDAELDSFIDHRAIKLVRDQMLAEQKAKKANKVKVKRQAKPSDQGNFTEAELRTLKESPHSLDAVALRIREKYFGEI